MAADITPRSAVLARYRAARTFTATPLQALEHVRAAAAIDLAEWMVTHGQCSAWLLHCYETATDYLASTELRPAYWTRPA